MAAIQTLYQYQLEDNYKRNLDGLIQSMINFYQNDGLKEDLGLNPDKLIKIKPNINYFIELVKYTTENLDQIDEVISSHLASEWNIKKLQILLLSILRVAIAELKFFPEAPSKVIINEFTDITSEILSDSEVGFVNSVLDKIAKNR